MSSEANTVNLPAVVGTARRLSKQPGIVQSANAPEPLAKNDERLRCLPRAGGFTSDDPICIDSDDDCPAPQKTEPEHVSQSLIESSYARPDERFFAAASVGQSKGQHLAKKRQRPSELSTSQSTSADTGVNSEPSHVGKGRHYLIHKRITFPTTKQEDQVSTANDLETGTWTFRIEKDSDSNSIDVIEILDDSDEEDTQKPSQPPPPTATQLNVGSTNYGRRKDFEETSVSISRHGVQPLSKTLTSTRHEPTPPNDTSVPLLETDGTSTGTLERPVPSESSISRSSHQDPPLTQQLAVPSKTTEGHELSDDETSSPDDSSDSSGPLEEHSLPQQRVDVGATSTLVPKESLKPQGTSSFPSPNPLLQRQFMDLLQPPPLKTSMITKDPRTPHAFTSLLLSPRDKGQWMTSMKSNNVLEEWSNMARRLRQWQAREDALVSQRCETEVPRVMSKTLKGRSQSKYLDPPNFQGGVDPPISREGLHDLGAMNFVPMYNQQYIDQETGLPCRKFTVIGSPDHIMYSFLLQVRTSSIPNAGYGLFLKFLGAKELKPSKRARGEIVRETRPVNPNTLFDKISLFHPRGFGMNLTIKGEHLKAPYNSLYTYRTLQMTFPDDRLHIRKNPTRTLNLKFSDPDIIYDDDELEGLRQPDKRIGHYGLFTEDDFVDAPRRTFSSLHSNCGYIDIGRYGPFLKEDRKIELIFDVKNFLFGFEPGMWSFGVPERILGREQVIDITDDLTGEPHAEARRNLTMYVNEVGHNHSLRETIHALDEDDRTITYFVMIDDCMKKGDEMEVFVNYKQSYEDNRERKGYGKKKLERS